MEPRKGEATANFRVCSSSYPLNPKRLLCQGPEAFLSVVVSIQNIGASATCHIHHYVIVKFTMAIPVTHLAHGHLTVLPYIPHSLSPNKIIRLKAGSSGACLLFSVY